MQCVRVLSLFVVFGASLFSTEIFVSPSGNDANPGTKARPLRNWEAAKALALAKKSAGPVTVWFRGGVHYLPETVVFGPEDSGSQSAPITYAAFPGEDAVISGGLRLNLNWAPYRDGIMVAKVVAGFTTDQLFVNGQRQHMARYPNYDPAAQHFDGWSADAFSPERAARWAKPAGGFIHAMHRHMWGDFHYRHHRQGCNGNITYEGGWQNNRRMGMHDKYRFVENIFEELDAPGEWFLDRAAVTSLFLSAPGPRSSQGHGGSRPAAPSRRVPRQRAQPGQMDHSPRPHLPPRRAHLHGQPRAAAAQRLDHLSRRRDLPDGAEDCLLDELVIDQVGGNAVFVNKYNRRILIRGCHISEAGANGVAFVGDPAAVRNPLFEYAQRQSLKDIDLTPGPKPTTTLPTAWSRTA